MTDHKTDDTGKGPSRAGEARSGRAAARGPTRPHATIDVKATEVGAGADTGRDEGSDRRQAGVPGGGKPEGRRKLPPPGTGTPWWRQTWTALAASAAAVGQVAARLAAAGKRMGAWIRAGALGLARGGSFLSHMLSYVAAGVAGAALTLAVIALARLLGTGGADDASDSERRLAAIESTLAQQSAAVPADLASRLDAVDRRMAELEKRSKKALEARAAAPEVTERIAKLEAALATVSANGKAGDAALAKRLDARLAEVEKLVGAATTAVGASARVEQDLAALRSETADLRKSLEGLKGSVDERVPARVAAFERELQALRRTEDARTADVRRALLTLELSGLKRALERGDSYTRELAAVRKLADGKVDLGALERSSASGMPTLGSLAESFRQVANKAVDAERAPSDPSVLDRLVAGARSVVRVRRAHYDAGDASVEATLFRMEAALRDGNLGEVLAQAERLPPKAAAAAAGWLGRLRARYAADQAIAQLEAALKASLAAERLPDAEPGQ